ncbi:MAG TPA: hypothetical protein PLU81_07395 [Deltaproteobacteria bacterium]|nr:hypothetical protein [Deltaproteobacteria bacterium]HPJ93285.1 hypothetical protein [Deltaproteobacteria bacterium]HPR51596.1 hypothetical protein [Deltaproteobacteria bacterium]
MKHQNFMLKVVDAKKAEIRKVLKDAGIEVRSLTEVYTEEIGGEAKEEDAEKKDES